ncbi:MAG: OmpA family protein [Saprospiraceae bacterium]|nr:OmpA family protein [Saprospiraceae bacterium]
MRILFVQILVGLAYLLLGSCAVGAQSTAKVSKAAQKIFDHAEILFKQGQLDEAEMAYLKVLDKAPLYNLARVRLGALYFDRGHYDESEVFLLRVLTEEPNQYPLVHYKLGEIAWMTNDYKAVSNAMHTFLDTGYGSPQVKAKARKYIRDANFMIDAKAHSDMVIKSLPAAINTTAAEYLPAMPATDAFMVFTRRVRGQEDFFISRRNQDSWLPAQPIKELNTPENEGAHAISADGKMLIFTACARRDGLGSCDLYFSVLGESGWSKPRNMGPTVNSKYWDGQPTLSANGLTLYFSSSRPGGVGGRDLWSTSRTPKGWSSPTNLFRLNTKDNDESPFLHLDGTSLYFMSDGHPGYGGTDLFLSRLIDENWTTPTNLGAPLNTVQDEGALHIDIAGTTGYFAREVSDQDARNIDIYKFPIPKHLRPTPATYAMIRILDGGNATPLQGVVDVYDLTLDKSFIRTYTDAKGELLVCLAAGKGFAIHAQKKGYTFFSTHINLEEGNTRLRPYTLEATLYPLEDAKENVDSVEPIILENVFFASGSAEILPTSLHELRKLYQLMDENKEMVIEIQGHTDDVGSSSDNDLLSTVRAEAIYNFLIEKGIPQSRMTYRGFGEKRPLVSNDTEAGRQRNRRTEFIITQR